MISAEDYDSNSAAPKAPDGTKMVKNDQKGMYEFKTQQWNQMTFQCTTTMHETTHKDNNRQLSATLALIMY